MSAEEKIEIHRGLKGVYFERSGTTFIDGKAGELRYRGYSIHDLAQHSSFEETAFLLLNGELPTAAELSAFDADLKTARALPPAVLEIIAADRPGLLSEIGKVFLAEQIDVNTAKIMTIGERAEDVFYITNASGGALTEDARERLREAGQDVERGAEERHGLHFGPGGPGISRRVDPVGHAAHPPARLRPGRTEPDRRSIGWGFSSRQG